MAAIGIGRRLIEALRREAVGRVVAPTASSAGRGLLEACGFRLTHALPVAAWFLAEPPP